MLSKKKTRLFQGAIFRWTMLDSGRLFTNQNRFQSHQDAWHLEHTATQDLLEGQKKPRIEKTIPDPRKMGKCYNVEGVWAGQMLTLQRTITYPT